MGQKEHLARIGGEGRVVHAADDPGQQIKRSPAHGRGNSGAVVKQAHHRIPKERKVLL